MKIVYRPPATLKISRPPRENGDVLELRPSDWDDFGYQTTFNTTCRIREKEVDLGPVQILIEDQQITRKFLNRLLKEGWDGAFPIPGAVYVSVPGNLIFYELLLGELGAEEAVRVAHALADASYLAHEATDPRVQSLISSQGFNHSLQRERGAQKAFLDGWKVLTRQATAVLDLGFRFRNVCGETSTLKLKFNSEVPLPHEVNALIGPNGVGKSRVLHQLVKHWISDAGTGGIGFVSKPNLSQLIVVSYSPFEKFPLDVEDKELRDRQVYRYFGFRGRTAAKTRLSHSFPKRNAAAGLIECLGDDQRYRKLHGWARKVKTVEKTLRLAFPFDYAAVEVAPNRRASALFSDDEYIQSPYVDHESTHGKRRYIPIASDRVDELLVDKLSERVLLGRGVTFLRDGKPVKLSSGQRQFAYVVINILGAMRRNSLLLIDEPELFLHPTLEIQFIELLKQILSRFNAKALLATHSEVIVREMPSRCVHVFKRTEDGVVVKHPPFQTFGGDVQRISSYVFGDSEARKPFESWISEQVGLLGSGEKFIEALGDDVNEELLIHVRTMDIGD